MGGIDVTTIIHAASGLVVGAGLGGAICYSFLTKKMKKKWPTVEENEQTASYKAKHAIAATLVIGMFMVVLLLFTGVVDLTDATVSAFAGFIFGHISNKVDPILAAYYGIAPDKLPHDDDSQLHKYRKENNGHSNPSNDS